MIEITKIGLDKKGYFKAKLDGRDAGLISFTSKDKSLFIIEHTKVKKEYQGQQIAWKLLTHLVNYARKMNYKVIPECEYAKSMFTLKLEIRDVLDPSYQV